LLLSLIGFLREGMLSVFSLFQCQSIQIANSSSNMLTLVDGRVDYIRDDQVQSILLGFFAHVGLHLGCVISFSRAILMHLDETKAVKNNLQLIKD